MALAARSRQFTRTRNFIVTRRRHTRLLEMRPQSFPRDRRNTPCALCKRLILIGFKCRLLDFLALVEGQHVDALQAFLLAGLQRSISRRSVTSA